MRWGGWPIRFKTVDWDLGLSIYNLFYVVLVPSLKSKLYFSSSIDIVIVVLVHIIANRLKNQKLFSEFNYLFSKIKILFNVMKL